LFFAGFNSSRKSSSEKKILKEEYVNPSPTIFQSENFVNPFKSMIEYFIAGVFMQTETNKWIGIVHDGWHHLLDDIEKLGDKLGFAHLCREEDIRSYFFCKISDAIREKGEWLIDLHAEQPLPNERADIVVGSIDDDSWAVGVEIKRKVVTDDLDKLCRFMKNGKVKSGVFAAIDKHMINWEAIFKAWGFAERFKFEPKDTGSNNYWEIRELKEIHIGDKIVKWDSLFFVLRKL